MDLFRHISLKSTTPQLLMAPQVGSRFSQIPGRRYECPNRACSTRHLIFFLQVAGAAVGDDDDWGTKDLNTCCGRMNVLIPEDIAPGDYLLRAEVIALHVASTTGGAQFYMSCCKFTSSIPTNFDPSQHSAWIHRKILYFLPTSTDHLHRPAHSLRFWFRRSCWCQLAGRILCLRPRHPYKYPCYNDHLHCTGPYSIPRR
jgi:Auxiliary Activity family 9 (formerly GH61)